MVDTTSRVENQILHFSKLEKWNRVDAHWAELVDNPPADPKFYAALAQRMVAATRTDELKTYIKTLVDHCLLADQHRTLLQAARGALTAVPNFDEIREPILTAVRAQYAQNPKLEPLIESSGLATEPNIQRAMNRFLQYVQCSVGEVFQHAVWGVGKVVEMSPSEGRVVVEFQSQGKKPLSFEGVRDFLKRIPKSHLFAQRLLNPAELARRADAEPVEFLKYCLKSLGGVTTQSTLKEHLLEGVFDAKKWSSWWGKNRQKFRLDPYIGFSGSVGNAQLELRKEPRSFASEMLMAFQQSETFSRRYTLVAEILKQREEEAISEEVYEKILAILRDGLSKCDPDAIAQRIEYHFLISEVQRAQSPAEGANTDDPLAFQLLDAATNPVEVVTAMTVYDYQVNAAMRVRDALPERWAERAEEVFLYGPMRLAQWALRDLTERGELETAGHMAEQLLHRPHLNPDLFLWLARAVQSGKMDELKVDVGAETLFSVVMELIDECQHSIEREAPDATALHGLQSRLANLLMDNHHAIVKEVFISLAPAEARERYRAIMDHPGLTPTFKVSFEHVVNALREDLEEPQQAGTGTQGGEHFVTAESFEARQKEFFHIKNEEIPKVSKAIGDAARMGDLSENAEYHSAKERQKNFFRRMEQLEDLLHRARILEPQHIATDSIGFGTEFEIKDVETGALEHFKLLGIWDADPDNHVISYQTPFGQQFMNRKVGETLTVTHPDGSKTRYEVLSIRNAFDAKE